MNEKADIDGIEFQIKTLTNLVADLTGRVSRLDRRLFVLENKPSEDTQLGFRRKTDVHIRTSEDTGND